MSFTLAPYETRQYFDGAGNPLNGGLIYVYEAGTATPTPTYKDSLGTLNTWPVGCDSEGRCAIFLSTTLSYTFIVKTSAGVVVPGAGGGAPGFAPVGAGSAGLGSVFAFESASGAPIVNTAYIVGAGFETLHPGTKVLERDSADLPGTYVLEATGLCYPAGTLTVAIVNLSDGAPQTPLATLTITNATGDVQRSGPITFGAPGTLKRYGIKPIVSANTGYLIGVDLVRTS